jgi:hypothetical protein
MIDYFLIIIFYTYLTFNDEMKILFDLPSMRISYVFIYQFEDIVIRKKCYKCAIFSRSFFLSLTIV